MENTNQKKNETADLIKFINSNGGDNNMENMTLYEFINQIYYKKVKIFFLYKFKF
jgi:hypothetical protein